MFGLVVLVSDCLNVWTVDSILEIHLLWILQKVNNIIDNPTPKKRCKFSLELLSLWVRCTHLSCVRSKNESECIDFQCQNFRAFIALKSVSRIVISIFNKTRTTDRTIVGTRRQNLVIVGLPPISHLYYDWFSVPFIWSDNFLFFTNYNQLHIKQLQL